VKRERERERERERVSQRAEEGEEQHSTAQPHIPPLPTWFQRSRDQSSRSFKQTNLTAGEKEKPENTHNNKTRTYLLTEKNT
jgi:hypothetical protein